MSDPTDEQLEKAKAAIASMRNAQINMTLALKRIDELERALQNTANDLSRAKNWIPKGAYSYDKVPLHDAIDKQVAAAVKCLGNAD